MREFKLILLFNVLLLCNSYFGYSSKTLPIKTLTDSSTVKKTASVSSFELEKGYWNTFIGKVGNEDVRLSIYLFNKGVIKGNCCYTGTEKDVKHEVSGSITGNNIKLTEVMNGKTYGRFAGKIFTTDLDRFEGVWTNLSTSEKKSFKLTYDCANSADYYGNRYNMYGRGEDVENFMKQVKKAILNNGKTWLAKHVKYPLNTTLNGKKRIRIKNEKTFIDHFNQICYPEFRKMIKADCTCNLFSKDDEVMLGNGEIWVGNTINSTEKKFSYMIVAINNDK
jgi:hypothetical protein